MKIFEPGPLTTGSIRGPVIITHGVRITHMLRARRGRVKPPGECAAVDIDNAERSLYQER